MPSATQPYIGPHPPTAHPRPRPSLTITTQPPHGAWKFKIPFKWDKRGI